METRAQLIAGELVRHGVEFVFGLPGVHNLSLFEALRQTSIRVVSVRHEQTAVYAADGAARVTGKVGVALTTTGPGAANALGATGEAWAGGSPVLIIATDIPSTLRRPGVYRGVLHETRDQGAMFAPVVKKVIRVGAAENPASVIWEAMALARTAPAGPVYVEVPTDLLAQPMETASEVDRVLPEPPAPEPTDVDRAAALCDAAERPLIWAGGGAVDAAPAVRALAARLSAPVLETYLGRGIGGPNAAGVPPHVPEGGRLWDEADLVIAIGSDLDGTTTQNWLQPQPPKLVAINVDPEDAAKNYAADVVIRADAAAGASALAERAGPHEPYVRQPVTTDAIEPDGRAFLDTFEAAVDPDVVVFCDMCIPGYWVAGFRPFAEPRRLGYPMGWGTLGFGFPASIGAALAQESPTLCVCGDGGFLFAAGELATVKQEAAPLTILLWDDGGYGMLRYDQERVGAEPFGVDLETPDWVQLAGSFGIYAERAATLDATQLRAHLDLREPSMLVIEAPALTPPPTTSPRWYRKEEKT